MKRLIVRSSLLGLTLLSLVMFYLNLRRTIIRNYGIGIWKTWNPLRTKKNSWIG